MNRKYIIRLSIVIVVLVIVFGAVFGFNLVKFYFMRSFLSHFHFPPAVIMAQKVKKTNFQPTFSAVGTVGAHQDVNVASQVNGTLMKYYVKSGQMVKKGQKLFELDYSTQAAQLKKAEAALALAKIQFDQANTLYKTQSNSKLDLDKAKYMMDQDAAAVKELQVEIAHHIIRAPFDGKMGIIPTNVGQFITAGNNLGTMTQTNVVDVTFPITQQQLKYVKVGTSFTFKVDTYPNKVYRAKVAVIDSGLSSKTRAIDVRGYIRNSDQSHLLYDRMLGQVNVLLPQLKNVIVVPQTAIVQSLYGTSAYVVKSRKNKKGKAEQYAHQINIETGPSEGNRTVVLKGINAGDMIVTTGQMKLQNGRTIKLYHPQTKVKGAH